MRVQPGDLIFGDGDGCVRLPVEHADEIVEIAGQVRAREAGIFEMYKQPDFTVEKMRKKK